MNLYDKTNKHLVIFFSEHGSGALNVKILIVRIIENKRIDANIGAG